MLPPHWDWEPLKPLIGPLIAVGYDLWKRIGEARRRLLSDTQKAFEYRFKEIYRPLYEALEKIHEHYLAVHLEIEKQLGIISGDFAEETDRQAYRELANEALAEIRELEKPFHDERDDFRREAGALYSATKDQDVKRFLGSIIHYFLDYIPSGDIDESTLDRIIEDVIRQTGTTYYETPYSRLERNLRDGDTPQRAVELINVSRTVLQKRLEAVRAAYLKLLTRAYDESTGPKV